MIETFSKLLNDPKTSILSFILGTLVGASISWIACNEPNNRIVRALEAEKVQLQNDNIRLKEDVDSLKQNNNTADISRKTQSEKSCQQIEDFIKNIDNEIHKKEEQVSNAAPISYRSEDDDSNPIYDRRNKELNLLTKQKETAKNKLLECLSN